MMRPLRVALVVKPAPTTRERDHRNMGWWSYAVPEFEWEHFSFSPDESINTNRFAKFDLIFQEDAGRFTYQTPHAVPVVYLSVDSTLSEDHYRTRFKQARQADLVLVDHDKLSRFPSGRRLNYCVNNKVFSPGEKTLDISFHCGAGASRGLPGGEERNNLRALLDEICRRHGWSYRSGGLGLTEYAASMGASRVIVNWPRTPANRPHRVFDAMASGAALVTGRLPQVDGDDITPGVHYEHFDTFDELEPVLEVLLCCGWESIARAGHDRVIQRHTWAVRARELREMLNRELGL